MKGKVSIIKQEAEIEASENEVKEFFNGIVPECVKEFGGLLADKVRFWRWSNQVDIIREAKVKIEASGLERKQVPLKVLLPILENSSLEEDELLKNKWSNLLANAISGNKEINPNYPEILKELSPLEVFILDKVYDEACKEADYSKRNEMQYSKQKICEAFKLSSEQADLIVENLFRLNLLRPPAGHGIMVGQYKYALRTTEIFEMTTLGFNFVNACKWGNV